MNHKQRDVIYGTLFHKSELQPLVTLSPFKTIAVQRTTARPKDARIVLVDWSLPSDYSSLSVNVKQQGIIAEENIRQITLIPDAGEGKCFESFVYLPRANQLIATKRATTIKSDDTSKTTYELIRFSNLL